MIVRKRKFHCLIFCSGMLFMFVLFSPNGLWGITNGEGYHKKTEPVLKIIVKGLRSSNGQVLLSLFTNQEGFPSGVENVYFKTNFILTNRRAEIFLKGIPYGEYAVSVIHDENSNFELDTYFIGIPKEGVGASRNPETKIGPPKYRDAVFKFFSDFLKIPIRLSYL